jgi:hypothetical protein
LLDRLCLFSDVLRVCSWWPFLGIISQPYNFYTLYECIVYIFLRKRILVWIQCLVLIRTIYKPRGPLQIHFQQKRENFQNKYK